MPTQTSAGASPFASSEVEKAAGRHLFEVVNGNMDAEPFKAELAKRRPNDPIADKRLFVRDDQLFHSDGKTYALTNQWSKTSVEALLASFKARFGEVGRLLYSPKRMSGSRPKQSSGLASR